MEIDLKDNKPPQYPVWYICHNAFDEEVWRGFNADVGRTPGWSTTVIKGQPFSAYLSLKNLLFAKEFYPNSDISYHEFGLPPISMRPSPPPATDEYVAPGCRLFSDPTKFKSLAGADTRDAQPMTATEVNAIQEKQILAEKQLKQWRKQRPLFSGVFNYFPDALMEVAYVSYVGNQQHNPGEEMHWSRGKSDDHMDCELRHLIERGTKDSDGTLHSAKRAWRALADLQLEIEASKKESKS